MQDKSNIESLLQDLSNPDETERIYAIEDLGELGNQIAIDPLLAQFDKETSVAVREAIASSLYEFDTPVIVEKVTNWLYSDIAATRNHAVRFLQSRGELNCDFLDSLFHTDSDPDIRKFIIDASMKFSVKNCSRFLSYGIKDEDVNVRIASVEYAGQRQIIELKNHVITLLNDTDEPMLMSSILECLSNFNDASTFEAIKNRFATLDEDDLYYAPWIARFYGGQGRLEDLDYLLNLLNTCPGQVDGILAEGISMILIRYSEIPIAENLYPWFEALFEQSEDEVAINHALQLLLSRIEDQPARDLLKAALSSFNRRTRMLAITAIISNDRRDIFTSDLKKRFSSEEDPELKEALANAIY